MVTAAQQSRWWRPGQRLAVTFAPQPCSVLVAAGSVLLRCSEGPLGGAPMLLHSRPSGEEITAMGTLPEVRPPHLQPKLRRALLSKDYAVAGCSSLSHIQSHVLHRRALPIKSKPADRQRVPESIRKSSPRLMHSLNRFSLCHDLHR